jgi:periplasmic protein CpxP/Spy
MKFRKSLSTLACALGVLLPMSLGAQEQPQAPGPPTSMGPRRPPMERAFGPRGPYGRWWDNPEVAERIGLTDDQKKKMDDVFQQARLKLIDLDAALKKEEVSMEPLVNSDQPDEAKLLAQIDRVAQARAELEKANARMLLGIRRVLTVDQWKKLQEMHRGRFRDRGAPSPGWGEHRGGPTGSGFVGPHGMDE